MRHTGCRLYGRRPGKRAGSEEPYEGNLHVRICGGRARWLALLPGTGPANSAGLWTPRYILEKNDMEIEKEETSTKKKLCLTIEKWTLWIIPSIALFYCLFFKTPIKVTLIVVAINMALFAILLYCRWCREHRSLFFKAYNFLGLVFSIIGLFFVMKHLLKIW